MTGLAAAPAFATSAPSLPQSPLCAYDDAQSSNDSAVPDSSDPQATLAAAQVTRAEIADKTKGIGFSGTGFTPDDKATVTVVGTDGTKYSPDTKLTVDEKGKVSGTYFFSTTENAQVPLGTYTLYLTDLKTEKTSSKVSFEVVADESDKDEDAKAPECERPVGPAPSTTPAQPPSPETPGTETPSETSEPSTTAPAPSSTAPAAPAAPPSTTPAAPESPATTAPAPKPTETTPEPTETSEEDAAQSQAPTAPADEPSAPADASEPAAPTAPDTDAPAAKPSETAEAAPSPGTEENAPKAVQAQAALSIEPTEISSEDFLNKGIKLGITGAEPGEEITIVVEHAQGKVDRYTMTKTADAEGKATFGVQAKVKAVLGTYNVRAQAASFDKPQGGSFTVVTNGTSVSEDTGNDLPRTGAEMTGLALGVGLLVVGAAAVVITRRRTQVSDDPAEF
ncbi:LPXTG-motif cell wall-anchored protein [Brevibacterium sanguinis]|uniref:LPXTG-motif cell wall-anchored protein n=2 Tax=Brevibacterium TaxID=1696 RepID=A0A366ILL8_9MICO|nr:MULTISPECIES: LPXTG cell wall anchor domain-containing protein [Brevibacterium]RBP67092.1 LPXTG-motif cell wall-anchored protein [Brevibacterium sanguinis]RBP73617.1 LPXTG-motif cell wall-anchored protein [Brevibacterium celere]